MALDVEDGPRVLVPQRIDAAPRPAGVVHVLGGETMGTTWSVRLVGPQGAPPARWHPAIQRELDLVVRQMSTWRPDSDVSRFNDAPAGSRHLLPAALREVLECALHVAEASDGAFDPAAGALVDLWGFGPGARYDAADFLPPGTEAVSRALSQGGVRRLACCGDAWIQPGGLRLDFSAIAKGHAVDRVAAALLAEGVASCLVEIGGELRGHGVKPDGQPWWVALQPPGEVARATRVALHGLSVATSGDYLRFFVDASGTRRAHTIDPRTGAPVAHGVASVSVLHTECMWADAWSTALLVLGPQAGLSLARLYGLAALFVVRTPGGLVEIESPALQAMAR